MVLVSSALENFIEEFKLSKSDNQVYFDARVDFKYGDREIQVESKVVMVNAIQKNHDTIYLLNTQLVALQFPEVFRSDRDFFSYYSGKYLIINGHDREGKTYMVLVQPLVQKCALA